MKVDGHAHLGCIQNATAGEEHRRGWHPERFEHAGNADKAVLVVGAGPAGMECAIVLGKRGFEAVHLVDAAGDIGGRLRWIRRLPTLGDWDRVVDWRRIQLDKLRMWRSSPARAFLPNISATTVPRSLSSPPLASSNATL
jgi:dimethylamine/trimethylamine dehydrogenase